MSKFSYQSIRYRYYLLFSAIMFVTSYGCSIMKAPKVSNFFFIITIITFCLSTSLFAKKLKTNIIVQLISMLLIICLFWDLSAIGTPSDVVNEKIMLTGFLLFNSTFIYLISVLHDKVHSISKMIDMWGKKRLGVLLLVLTFILLNIPAMTALFRSDSLTYYNAILDSKYTWDFTLNNISLFFLCGHNTVSVSILYFIGEYLFSGLAYGLRLMLLLLSCVTILAFDDIIKMIYKNINTSVRLGLVGIFSFSPLFFGLFYELGTDFPMMCFYILFIWSYAKKLSVFEFVFLAATCLAKETGIILCCSFFVGEFLYNLMTTKRRFRNLFKFQYAIYFIIPVFFILSFFQKSTWIGLVVNSGEVITPEVPESLVKANSITFNIDYILRKLNELFIMHFHWILVVFIIVCVILICKKKIVKQTDDMRYTLPIFISFLGFTSFNLLFITYLNYRYIATIIFFLTYAVGYCMDKLKFSKEFKKYFVISVFIIFFIESYYTIDPITKLTTDTINVGSADLVYTKTYIKSSEYPKYFVSIKDDDSVKDYILLDGGATNRQIMGLENIIEAALSEINFGDSDVIVIPNIFLNDTTTMYNLFGNRYINDLKWNSKTKNISYEKDKTTIKYLSIDKFESDKLDSNSKYYYFDFYIDDKHGIGEIDTRRIGEVYEYSSLGWKLDVFQIE